MHSHVSDAEAIAPPTAALLPLPSARRTFAVLTLVALALSALTCLNIALGHTSPLLRLADTGLEANVASWFSSAMWLTAAAFALAIGAAGRRCGTPGASRWLLVGGGFLLLAIDETGQAHEATVGPLMDLVERSTGLEHTPARLAAVACVGVALLAIATWLWPWARTLPAGLRRQLTIAALVFVGSALGLEALSRMVDTPYLSPCEELGEMLGVALLLTTLQPHVGGVLASPTR